MDDDVECEQAEILGVLDLTETILTKFGFAEYEVMLSTRPEKAVGSDEIWERATGALEGALQQKGWSYGVDEGGGAFYGPKIDIKIRDAIGRLWQCSTIQCDFNLPERFDMEYASADGTKERPIMVHHPAPPHTRLSPHPPLLTSPPLPLPTLLLPTPLLPSSQVHRAIFGSLERFFGVLLESTAGDFPFWLAPVQLRLLPVVGYVVRPASPRDNASRPDRTVNR